MTTKKDNMSSRNSTTTEQNSDNELPQVIHIYQEPLDELLSGWWDSTITGDVGSGFEFTLVEEDAVDSRSQHSSDKGNIQCNYKQHPTPKRAERIISNE